MGRLREQELAPLAARKISWSTTGDSAAKGSIRTKNINGRNYLYHTILISGGDRDRRSKRLKSTYIGYPNLADWIQMHLPHADTSKRKLRRTVLHHLLDLYITDALTDEFDVEALEAFVERQRNSGDKS